MSPRALKPSHTSGKKFVAGLGVGFAFIAVGLFFGLRAYIRHVDALRPPPVMLRWQDRDLWPVSAVTPFEVEYGSIAKADTGKNYRTAEFALAKDPAEELRIETALLACAALARDPGTFRREATRDRLAAFAKALPAQFYPAYLLSAWHTAHGDPAGAAAWMAKAVGRAPAMLMESDHPPGAGIPTLAIAFDRIRSTPKKNPTFLERLAHHTKDQTINRNLILVYPSPTADSRGRVWLPVFHDMYRWADPRNAGPQESKDWFSMADGIRVGHLNAPGSKVPPRP